VGADHLTCLPEFGVDGVEIEGGLLEVGAKLEELVRVAQHYGQLRHEEELVRQVATIEEYIERLRELT